MSIRKPFGYEPLLTKEDIKNAAPKKKKQRANDWKKTLGRIWHIVDEQRVLLIIVLLMVVVSSALSLLGPFLIGKMIDTFVKAGTTTGMITWVIALVVIYAVLSLSLFFQNYWMIGIAQQTVYRLRTSLFAHFQQLPISFFDKRQHGELMSRATNDIEAVNATLNTAFIQVFSSVITLTGTVAVMLYLSPLLTLLTMIIIPTMFYGMRWVTRRTGKLFKEQQQAVGALNGMIEETISGQRIVKAFSQETRMQAEFEEKSRALRRASFWAQSYSGYIPKIMNVLNNFSFTIVAGVGGLLAVNGQITVGVIVIFTEYARQFTRPLNDLANQFNTVLSAIAGAERVFMIMDEPIEQDTPTAATDVVLQGAVSFENVVFSYTKDAQIPTLQHVSFAVQPGETVALVGATGAGKTTIMQLIARFYDADYGAVTFDGKNVKEIARSTLRSQLAFVLQDPFLFEMSVMDNIRYGRLDATEDEVIAAAVKANAHDFVTALPQGYQTILTADGSEISQGQKQLLSIARALLADPKILLLDEATSSIDTITEMKIQEALEYLMQGRTSFVIAHRLNTVRNADTIFVMQAGKLIEAGPQQQLIEQGGVYATMLANSKQ
ncbi:multidrug ABC transporter ATP-binding protein [Lysinibacillus sp. BF-4]|uniref:ABC transporter ATP-binding protein n=1 Tax=Lysinibacillus sp. BF-4 TaxID=1473546 RepID=UPI00050156AF|nr:ABC transporter ATP-binding protein [Lysinibacillus sp. BF-4]KFL43049.1 multidrug ABC transporter ATP-binding protein [Lysinibacillus sp. BF-4]